MGKMINASAELRAGRVSELPGHQGVGGLIICDGEYIGCVTVKQTSESHRCSGSSFFQVTERI